MEHGVNRWDWVFTVGPFVVLAAVAYFAVRRARKAAPRG